MIFRLASIARSQATLAGRRYASSSVTTSTSSKPLSPLNSFARAWYNMFGSSTARYATFLAVGVIAVELITNATTDALWELNNRGKTYKQVDWSKFDPPDDDEEEEEEEEEDDDE
ncbi:ubiquinol-cytochrome C reductase, UQCRX/QCR9 like protein [Nitzschia inconspicua]|uniref:Ubiquinol-cytochrome C reductase, UQCRX/QCR9 like protein n=1 Tax=Nitzschia inconspicua TaxID=303405 RepID=A0A9K3PES7_9STRA|nr:ubiquinol-cytochrome C reductase, UQCRX/QCR9 like protein [Nitzschia inconspicua]